MAQWNKTTQDYLNQERSLFEVYCRANEYGYIENEGASARSAFGERLQVPVTPVIQMDAVYGLDPRKIETLTYSASGVATSEDGMFKVSAGSDANSYGVVRSRNFLRYRPGQGALTRFTASFTSNPTGFTQRAGLFNQEQALQIGYDTDGRFGVLRANGGKAHIHEFVFSAIADGTVTVQLNGTSFTGVAVAGGSVAANIAALAAGLQQQALFNALYIVEYNETKLRFLATSLGPQNGTNNVTSTATVTFTSAHLQLGVAQTENWTYQENWNLDKLDGTGTSGVTLDPSKLNVYQINFRWLGAGEMRYAIENPLNGDMMFFHHEHYTNRYEHPHLDNPSLKIGYVAANLGGGVGVVTTRGASFMGAIEGIVEQTRLPYSVTATRTDSMNSPGSLYHLLTLKNKLIYQGKINTRDLLPKRLTASVNTTGDPAVIRLFWNPTFANNMRWTNQTDYNASLYATENSTGLFTLSAQSIPPVAAYHVSNGDTIDVDLTAIGIHVPPNSYLTAVITSSSNITAASASFIYVED